MTVSANTTVDERSTMQANLQQPRAFMTDRNNKVNRRIIGSTIAFAVYTIFAITYSHGQPGLTTLEASRLQREAAAMCSLAKEFSDDPLAQAKACMPVALKRPDTWILFGMLALGANMLAAAVAARREQPETKDCAAS